MKIRPILWTYHKTKNREYPIKIRVTSSDGGKTTRQYYPLNFTIKKEEWDNKAGRVKIDKRTNGQEINLRIISMTNEIERNFLNNSGAVPGQKESFYWWFEERLKYSKAKHGTYNYEKLDSVCKKLKEYAPTLTLKQLNYEFIKKFEAYLLAKGNHHNTVADNLIRIRLIVSEIVKSQTIPNYRNPFTDIKITKKKTSRKRLNEVELNELLNLKIKEGHPSVQLAVWMYLYSFYNGGIRFGDLCRQRWDMIENGRLRYIMHKSTVEKNIKLHTWVIAMLKQISKKGPYIFNTGVDWSNEDTSIKNRNSFFRTKLKTACRWARIPEITFHTARNTLADISVKKNINPLAMKNIFGHAKFSTTEQYLKSFYSEESDEAMDKLFKKTNGKKKT